MNIRSFTNPSSPLFKDDRTYPWLGVGEDLTVVLFSEIGIGTTLNQFNNNRPMGEHRTDWVMSKFEPFYGEIKLMSTRST